MSAFALLDQQENPADDREDATKQADQGQQSPYPWNPINDSSQDQHYYASDQKDCAGARELAISLKLHD
ncbi:MAG: hypothetical protein ACI88C_000672 [Acidimicrobiales bacterium]|jgi:hypothetical protein